jgi:hypothetical protein
MAQVNFNKQQLAIVEASLAELRRKLEEEIAKQK